MSEGQRAKPRFVPKKKQTTSGDGADAVLTSGDTQSIAQGESTEGNTGAKQEVEARRPASQSSHRSTTHDAGRGEGRGGRGRGGRGRGNFASNPSGKAFFSGDSGGIGHSHRLLAGTTSSAHKANAKQNLASAIKEEVAIKNEPRFRITSNDGFSGGIDTRTLGSETTTTIIGGESDVYAWDDTPETGRRAGRGSLRGRALKGEQGSFQYNIPNGDASSDSDVDMEDNEQPLHPADEPFRESAPVALSASKSGPSAGTGPLLLNTTDEVALQREQEESIFLLQLPSGFCLPKRDVPRDTVGLDPEVKIVEPPAAKGKCGKIGKLQLMSSGRLYIVLSDNTRFEVHRGIKASFSQQLSAIYTDANSGKNDNTAHTDSKNAKHGASSTSDEYEPGLTQGQLYTMGPITAKWTVTPAHEIGEIKKKLPVVPAPVGAGAGAGAVSSSSSSSSSRKVKQESEETEESIDVYE